MHKSLCENTEAQRGWLANGHIHSVHTVTSALALALVLKVMLFPF